MSSDIRRIKAKHEKQLLNLPNVVSVGIGLNDDQTPAIVVGMAGPNPDSEARVLEILKGHPVRVEVIGDVKSQ